MTEPGPTTSADGRYVVVDGRRWRASDPSIPDGLRRQLVRQLMAARRAVHSGRDDADATARARRCVHDAKVALGERGRPWWDPPDVDACRERIAATIRTLLRDREPGKTICPSEVARVVGQPEWRRLMDPVREVGRRLAERDVVELTSRGRRVDVARHSGPIRYRAGARFERP